MTPFGEVTLHDAVSIGKWAAAHAADHQRLVVEHIGPQGGILDEPIDGDWMYRHTARHVAIATASGSTSVYPAIRLPPLSSADTKVLSLPGEWATEDELQDWHALHTRLHTLIDRARQIAGVQAKPNAKALPGRPANILPPIHGGGVVPPQ
jgi:hypothetical protein